MLLTVWTTAGSTQQPSWSRLGGPTIGRLVRDINRTQSYLPARVPTATLDQMRRDIASARRAGGPESPTEASTWRSALGDLDQAVALLQPPPGIGQGPPIRAAGLLSSAESDLLSLGQNLP